MVQKNLKLLISCFRDAVKVSIKSAIWLLKMMIPITLLVAMLDFWGVIDMVSGFVEPLFKYCGLDAKGVFVFITAIFTAPSPAIAVIATLGIGYRMVIILAIMMCICHALPVESTIQKRCGYPVWASIIGRIVAAYVVGVVVNQILPSDLEGSVILTQSLERPTTILMALKGWAFATSSTALKIILFIYMLNVLQQFLKKFNLIDKLIKPLLPLMTIMGLPHSTAFLWLVANTLGISYGGTVIINEYKNGELKDEDMSLLNTSIGITHSLVEDCTLFVAIGVPLFWLMVPRLICSTIAVWIQRGLIFSLKKVTN